MKRGRFIRLFGAVLPKPQYLHITASDATTITYAWTDVLGVDGYEINIYSDAGRSTLLDTFSGVTTPYVYTKSISTNYFAVVRAYKGTEYSEWSNEVALYDNFTFTTNVTGTDPDKTMVVTPSGGTQPYRYSINTVDAPATYQASDTFTGLADGTYYVYVQDAFKTVTHQTVVPEYNPDAQDYFDRVVLNGGAALTTSLKILLNDFFIDSQAGAYLPDLRLHLWSNEHEVAACTNLISDSFLASLVGSPTFAQYNYIQPNGSTGYIDTGYKPSDNGLNDASYGFCQKNNANIQSSGITAHGALNNVSNQRNFILPNNAGSIEGNINGPASSLTIQVGQTTEVGQTTIARISSTQIQGGRNGVWAAAVSENSTSLESDNLYEGAINNDGTPVFFSNTQMQYSFNSTGWTEAKDLALYNRMQTLLTDIAAL